MIIDGKLVAKQLQKELTKRVATLNYQPELVIVQVGNDFASNKYIASKMTIGREIGIYCRLMKLRPYISQHDLEILIHKLSKDQNVHGIILQLPIPQHFDVEKIINIIDPQKDPDGLTKINQAKLIQGEKTTPPATPKGIITLLDYYKVRLQNRQIVIVGQGRLVGKPLSYMLQHRGANVVTLNSTSKTLAPTRKADVLIVATGVPHLIKKADVQTNAVVIDVGITRINNQIVGDVDFAEVQTKAALISPAVGGVGPMTVISLFENFVNSLQLRQNADLAQKT